MDIDFGKTSWKTLESQVEASDLRTDNTPLVSAVFQLAIEIEDPRVTLFVSG
jgi:hypothetical protein